MFFTRLLSEIKTLKLLVEAMRENIAFHEYITYYGEHREKKFIPTREADLQEHRAKVQALARRFGLVRSGDKAYFRLGRGLYVEVPGVREEEIAKLPELPSSDFNIVLSPREIVTLTTRDVGKLIADIMRQAAKRRT